MSYIHQIAVDLGGAEGERTGDKSEKREIPREEQHHGDDAD